MREDPALRSALQKPAAALDNRPALVERLDELATISAEALSRYRAARLKNDMEDEFKVDFKSQTVLRTLANQVVQSYLAEH
jgi:hypothetical protein